MKFLVVGCGSIGKRHISNLKTLGVTQILACDVIEENLAAVKEFDVSTYNNFETALKEKPDAVLICTPPNMHAEMAKKSLLAGGYLFIEKPISDNMKGLEEIKKLAKGKIVQIGYNLRFNPCLIYVKKLLEEGKLGKILYFKVVYGNYLPNWRPNIDYRKNYSARKEMGGGILLDDSHEIDYPIWLFGNPESISCIASKTSDLEINTEDTAEINLRFKNGIIGNIHMDFVRQDPIRQCEIICEKGTIRASLLDYFVEVYENKKWIRRVFRNDPNQMYIDELKYFIDCINKKKEPEATLEEGICVLKLVLAAKESSEKEKEVKL